MLAAVLAATLTASCALSAAAKPKEPTLTAPANDVARIIASGQIERLAQYLPPSNSLIDESGAIHEETRCFLNWKENCPIRQNAIQRIASSRYFIFYYHLSADTIIVSYIDSSKRDDFNRNPEQFLESGYLESYFSCQFSRAGEQWLLDESVCFSESEGPFSPDPEV